MTDEKKGFKRVTVYYKQPNPLFERWLSELYNNSLNKGSSNQYIYGKALRSLQKYPLPLKTGKECLILDNFGGKLCKYLDWKLDKHRNRFGCETNDADDLLPKPVKVQSSVQNSQNGSQSKTTPQKRKRNEASQTKRKSTDSYVPALRSGPYALLITLLSQESRPEFPGYLTKTELLKEAQPLCDVSLTKAIPGSKYTAWSSMSSLVNKGFVSRTGCPARFSLTGEGRSLAVKLLSTDSSSHQTSSFSIPSTSASQVTDKPLRRSLSSPLRSTSPIRNGYKVLPASQGRKPSSRPPKPAAQSSSSSQTPEETDGELYQVITMEPGTFDIILLVDTSETTGNSNRTKAFLADNKVCFEVRRLKVGDFVWIARDRASKCELLLPYIVERKRMDDLGGSIKDGRYHEQKFRLKKCGISNLIYLVENHGHNEHLGLPLASVQQAAVNTRVVDGFQVKYTNDLAHSMLYLAALSLTLKTLFKDKTLISTCKSELADKDLGPRADIAFLITYKEFNKTSCKKRKFTIRELFIRQLLQLHGLSVGKAIAVVDAYSTPRALRNAFEASNEELLANIPYGTDNRKLGSAISKTLHRLYTSTTLS